MDMLKRLLILFFLVIAANVAYSQDIIMSKEKHEQLRKNVEDYKLLIKAHKTQQIELDALKTKYKAQNDKIAELELQLVECKNQTPKKNIFQKIGLSIKNFTRKLKPHKNKQDW